MVVHRASCRGLVWSLFAGAAAAQTASRATEHALPDLPKSCYFVVPAREAPAAGKGGGLVVVLPGGDGSREFLPWVENGLLAQAPTDCTGVLITAVKWHARQEVVWPTKAGSEPGMQYTTEQYVRAVIAKVTAERGIDPQRVTVVAWSSSGPAVFPLLAKADAPFTRAYLAMSVWPGLTDLTAVKGRRVLLDQSPDDKVTPFRHARSAYEALHKAGAVVRVVTYRGGHGWQDDPLPRLQDGLAWLFGDAPAEPPVWPGSASKRAPKGGNLLDNAGFERGDAGWSRVDNSGTLQVEVDRKQKAEGKQALRLGKPAGGKLDLLTQSVELPAGKTVAVSAQWRSQGVTNAWLKVWLYDAADQPVHEAVDLLHVTADGDWQTVRKDWPRQGAVRATVQVVLVSGGSLWLDDVVLTVAN